MHIQKNVTLAPYTSYKIGGEARFFAVTKTKEDIISAIDFATSNKIKFYVLGGGSNVLFADKGFNGLVILNQYKSIDINDVIITVGSGEILSLFIKKMILHGLGGMESLFGIPGTIGGAIYQNAGAYKSEIGEFITSIKVIDDKGVIKSLKKEKLDFGYRYSIIKDTKDTILDITLKLKHLTKIDIEEKLKEITSERSSNKPYGKSSGSFFKNPNPNTSAGKLIDMSGLKGLKVGGALVSEQHANYLLNAEKASAKDLKTLSKKIKKTVYQKHNIQLEEEVQIISY